MEIETLTIRRPDDWHIHLRDGDKLARTVSDAAKQFSRALVMPNLLPPVTTALAALQYRERILAQLPAPAKFTPYMTLYLTDNTTAEMIATAAQQAFIIAAKLYPAGATTNSDSGVTDIKNIYPALEAMQKHGMVLCVHGEVTQSDVDIFDREAKFIDQMLIPLIREFPQLKIVVEHITTKNAVEFVTAAPLTIAATITAHHLLLNRNDLLVGGIKPHYYCLPVLKRTEHQQALITAATSGNAKFFLGTDSAPHSIDKKESCCGCAGIYTAHAAIELYAQIFDAAKALNKLENFASCFGAQFYSLPLNESQITLIKKPWTVAKTLTFGTEQLQPLAADEELSWQLKD